MILFLKKLLTIPILFLFFILVSSDHSTFHGGFLKRTSRSLGDIIKQLFGRRNHTIRTGFQGVAQTFHPYNAEASSFFPSYYLNPYQGIVRVPFHGYDPLNGYVSFYTTGGAYTPAASSYIPYGSSVAIANPAEFQSALDRYLRGVTSSNKDDQEASGSSVDQIKGPALPPILSLKRFYSLPLYFFSDNPELTFAPPYFRKHIRRASQEAQKDGYNRYIQLIQQHSNPYYQGVLKSNLKSSIPEHHLYLNQYLKHKRLQSPSSSSSQPSNSEENKDISIQPTYYYSPPSSYSLALEPNKISLNHDKDHSDQSSEDDQKAKDQLMSLATQSFHQVQNAPSS